MTLSKKIIAVIMTLIMAVNCSMFGVLQVIAHEAMLDVVYDNCTGEAHADGIDEMWYIINWGSSCPHLSHEEYTIKYYFEETSKDGTYTWTTDVSEAVAQEIKTAYADSMKKWNDVYFYSYDSSGNVVKHKIINIIEGTASDHNLSIYPTGATSSYGTTGLLGTPDKIESGAILINIIPSMI